MKDKYTGDIGDFAKIILLNELSSIDKLILGINWYYNNRAYNYEKNQKDGKHVQYLLNDTKDLKKYAIDIYQSLSKIIQHEDRKVENLFRLIKIRKNHHFCDFIPDKRQRVQWIASSLTQLSNANLIFLDPDNGICYNDNNGNVKHVMQKEIVQMFQAGKSIVVYNHSDRKNKNDYLEKFKTISGKLYPEPCKIFILRASLYSARDYVFFLQDSLLDLIESKLFAIEKNYPDLFKLSIIKNKTKIL